MFGIADNINPSKANEVIVDISPYNENFQKRCHLSSHLMTGPIKSTGFDRKSKARKRYGATTDTSVSMLNPVIDGRIYVGMNW